MGLNKAEAVKEEMIHYLAADQRVLFLNSSAFSMGTPKRLFPSFLLFLFLVHDIELRFPLNLFVPRFSSPMVLIIGFYMAQLTCLLLQSPIFYKAIEKASKWSCSTSIVKCYYLEIQEETH